MPVPVSPIVMPPVALSSDCPGGLLPPHAPATSNHAATSAMRGPGSGRAPTIPCSLIPRWTPVGASLPVPLWYQVAVPTLLRSATILAATQLLGCAAKPGGPAAPDAGGPAVDASGPGPHAAHHRHAHAMTHRFENADAWARHFEDPERAAWQKPDAVVSALHLAPDARVADVGAGTGYFSVRLARAVPRGKVYASDIEPDMIRYLRERADEEGLANLVAVQGRPDDPALPEPVDLVFLCDVVHHIADRTAFFTRVRDELAPAGRVVIVDFEPDAPADAPGPPPEHRLSPERIAEELGPAGLRLEHADRELLPHQYVLTFTAAPAPG